MHLQAIGFLWDGDAAPRVFVFSKYRVEAQSAHLVANAQVVLFGVKRVLRSWCRLRKFDAFGSADLQSCWRRICTNCSFWGEVLTSEFKQIRA